MAQLDFGDEIIQVRNSMRLRSPQIAFACELFFFLMPKNEEAGVSGIHDSSDSVETEVVPF